MKRQLFAVAVVVSALAVHGSAYQDIAKLKDESIAESLVKLSDVSMFNLERLPRPDLVVLKGESIPLGAQKDHWDLEAIMSNRRFRKVFEHLSGISKDAASEMVNRELSAALAEYLPLYERSMRGIRSPEFKARLTNSQAFSGVPAFAIANVPEGEVVVSGARLKVLALVWTSGMLGLSGSKDPVERVARLAVKQRAELYGEPNLDSFFKAQTLKGAGLYNRQILSTGLLGVEGNLDLEASATKAAGVEWQERRLTLYNDLSGAREPDYSLGSLTVRFAAPMDDAHFDLLLKELHLGPQTGNPEK